LACVAASVTRSHVPIITKLSRVQCAVAAVDTTLYLARGGAAVTWKYASVITCLPGADVAITAVIALIISIEILATRGPRGLAVVATLYLAYVTAAVT
jgi:hypothetical protein